MVLEALKLDCRAQGKCLMGATEMGQLAMEYLDDRKFEFSKLEKEIKANMKERERTLKLVRREVAYLTDSFPSLIRKEVSSKVKDFMTRCMKTNIFSHRITNGLYINKKYNYSNLVILHQTCSCEI